MMNRRELLAGVAAAAALRAAPLGLPLGCQTYPVREALGKDFDGTLRELAAAGYRAIEMCSPPGYEKSGYGSLVGMSASEMKKRINAAGLTCESCHYTAREFKENLGERIAFAKQLGLKQMILSSFGLRQEATMAEWVRAAQELNEAGAKINGAGMQAGFHNHAGEFKEIDGVLVYDKLLAELDPKLVKMQFQVSVISLGFEAATYMAKYPGRFVSLHLQDWAAAEKKQVPVGQGSVDWNKLFATAKKGGVKNYYVEMNMEALKASVPYLRDLKV